MKANNPIRIKTISQYHEKIGLPKPDHPYISIINPGDIRRKPGRDPICLIYDFYIIAFDIFFDATIKYGQQEYRIESGDISFMAPKQVFTIIYNQNIEDSQRSSGWMILIHPDFLWNTSQVGMMKRYEFFGYTINEALKITSKEKKVIRGIVKSIREEYNSNIDKFSQNIMIAHLEVLLNYAERFYQRQFIRSKMANHKVLERLEDILEKYFETQDLMSKGLPTAQYIADALHIFEII
ncbi:AraC family transcriptional regulator [Mucilaginibacter sp. PAMB04274]|uniref:AraC family transcriptional regulator n=1 Tax=Mucilaginibacter sp. PAMB04274 TaxID=3138568 RepID=UPI0031F67786